MTYDIKRELKAFYAPKNTDWQLVDVPDQQFIGIDGKGNPNTAEAYARAVQALYTVAYTLKFASKRGLGRDFVVGPLEGLWYSDDPSVFTVGAKDLWSWTMLISQPAWITADLIKDAVETALAKKKAPTIGGVRRVELREGRCAQLMHVGSYDDEAPALARLHSEFIPANGLREAGEHHEIYLSDPRKIDAAKLRTVLRQPVSQTGRR
ncbi:GyrI-like domain-containing protein [Fodinicola acaciae]|uniref:GyrI-like domain-containing protein n=1 Tax=Fodinicola acaciae TaxID=2681555 RepID=UPI0013D09D9A|nr:GyrI-like domain-containing protein [Fodinicola acaciae]